MQSSKEVSNTQSNDANKPSAKAPEQQSVGAIVASSHAKTELKLSASMKKQPIKLALNNPTATANKSVASSSNLKRPNPAVKVILGDSDDSEPEEMPPEAKMRMRNVGRDTPTSAGPNSFFKGRLGFTDQRKLLEKELEKLEKFVSDS